MSSLGSVKNKLKLYIIKNTKPGVKLESTLYMCIVDFLINYYALESDVFVFSFILILKGFFSPTRFFNWKTEGQFPLTFQTRVKWKDRGPRWKKMLKIDGGSKLSWKDQFKLYLFNPLCYLKLNFSTKFYFYYFQFLVRERRESLVWFWHK